MSAFLGPIEGGEDRRWGIYRRKKGGRAIPISQSKKRRKRGVAATFNNHEAALSERRGGERKSSFMGRGELLHVLSHFYITKKTRRDVEVIACLRDSGTRTLR